MDLLITDVTEMHGDSYCVAGWCAAEERMVRPLIAGAHWTGELLEELQIAPGARVRFDVVAAGAPGEYPHRTEDTNIDIESFEYRRTWNGNWVGPAAPPTTTRLADIFHGLASRGVWDTYRYGVHVPAGTQTRSLGALRLRANAVALFLADGGQLRAHVVDDQSRFSLPVSSHVLKEAHRNGGLEAAAQHIPAEGRVHVRVGLARPWHDRPDECYVMVNGIYA